MTQERIVKEIIWEYFSNDMKLLSYILTKQNLYLFIESWDIELNTQVYLLASFFGLKYFSTDMNEGEDLSDWVINKTKRLAGGIREPNDNRHRIYSFDHLIEIECDTIEYKEISQEDIFEIKSKIANV